jgi:1,4-dihydroxy-2-naphthoyl-CoA hydrolase
MGGKRTFAALRGEGPNNDAINGGRSYGVVMAIWKKDVREITSQHTGQVGTMIDHLGIEVVEIGDDWIKARMPVDRRTVQPQGRLHGGASVALAETVGSIAANMVIAGNDLLAVGLDINANHIRPVKDGYVFGTATPESVGRSAQVWSIRITDEANRLVCISRLTMAVIPMGKG